MMRGYDIGHSYVLGGWFVAPVPGSLLCYQSGRVRIFHTQNAALEAARVAIRRERNIAQSIAQQARRG